jgi:hypothetical protein
MRITTDAVQNLRWLRVHEGVPGREAHARREAAADPRTSQVQRVVIARNLLKG